MTSYHMFIHVLVSSMLYILTYLLPIITHSYERSYKPLVDNMIQKDLALKGYLEGVELLIFASNQLPRNCQRKNSFTS